MNNYEPNNYDKGDTLELDLLHELAENARLKVELEDTQAKLEASEFHCQFLIEVVEKLKKQVCAMCEFQPPEKCNDDSQKIDYCPLEGQGEGR